MSEKQRLDGLYYQETRREMKRLGYKETIRPLTPITLKD